MSVRASRRLIHPWILQLKPLPKPQQVFQKQKLSISVRVRRCLQTRVGGQRGCRWLIGTRVRFLSVGVHAQSLLYSNATRHQRSTPLLPQRPRNLSLALLPLTNRASPDLNRALRFVHRILMHRSTQPHRAMNHQHNSQPNFPSRLPCHRPSHLCLLVLAMPV